MTITTRYADLEQLKENLFPANVSDTTDDKRLGQVLDAVSRAIDHVTKNRFHTTDSDETRYFTARFNNALYPDIDIVSITTLKTDEDGDRTYEKTWTTSDYDLMPYNASLDGIPYSWIETTPEGDYYFPTIAKGVEIAGKFGWAQCPDGIREACLLLAVRLWKRKDAIFGTAGVTELGIVRLVTEIRKDPDLMFMLGPFIRGDYY